MRGKVRSGLAVRGDRPRLGLLGIVLGIDMVLLFVATAAGIGPLVLPTGGLASVVLGPMWWVSVARLLWAGDRARQTVAS